MIPTLSFLPISLEASITLVERLASVGVLISAAEYLYRNDVLTDAGLLSWEVSSLRRYQFASGRIHHSLSTFFSHTGMRAIFGLQAVVALFLLLGPATPALRAICVVTLALCMLLCSLRATQGADGADQMLTLLFTTLSIARCYPSPTVQWACLWFIAAQSCLSYITAGIAKLISLHWRDGTYLAGIFSTRMYGAPAIGVFMRRNPRATAWLACGTIAWECLFPLVLIAPAPIALLILFTGFTFHLASAFSMGLNTFLWAFVATYPAILAVARL